MEDAELKSRGCYLLRQHKQLILANGSERGEYVPMKEIFSKMHQLHDGIQLMKTYYPYHEGWQTKERISLCTKKKNVSYAWDYEYDDYHPLDIFEDNSSTLKEMTDIKCYGADIHFTLTMDINLADDEIRAVFERFRGFGRIYFRINHESNGSWFTHNKEHTFEEVADFFVRCHYIIKSISREFYTVFSITADVNTHENRVLSKNLKLNKKELNKALKHADYWSMDKYVSLHFGWPFTKMTSEFKNHYWSISTEQWWRFVEETYLQMILSNAGVLKPLFINEFNSDSDVDGFEKQAEVIREVYERIRDGELDWIEGITLYQFRDRGGLGLEIENDRGSATILPALAQYREVISTFKDQIKDDRDEIEENVFSFEWHNMSDIRGVHISDLKGLYRIKNITEVPYYIFFVETGEWHYLSSDEELISKEEELCIFIPPYEGKGAKLEYSYTIVNVKKWISEVLIEYTEKEK